MPSQRFTFDTCPAMTDLDIHNAQLYENETCSSTCIRSVVSQDHQRLVRVYQEQDAGILRVKYFRRGVEPSMEGEWWLSETPPSSITDTLAQADRLVQEYLKGPEPPRLG